MKTTDVLCIAEIHPLIDYCTGICLDEVVSKQENVPSL